MNMVNVELPYGRSRLSARIRECNYLGTFEAALPRAAEDGARAVGEALDAPIGSPPLEELAAELAQTLDEMRADGTIAQILQKYGLDVNAALGVE